jgi:hypothetical protein
MISCALEVNMKLLMLAVIASQRRGIRERDSW